ncbi:LysR substrate-binding domain-containing protein [Subtercola frigoramans]|uniref:DNA-binding transcriptional LysR family regulator n=1 Tax=Subtercola frigoramans TaxID=120298 RepID=A0ABS2L0V9_9MICO|nr:LysR substrate-binding domain-containing protein [Subtercola frigoramans]MBM7470707.1 DNA-binding transcriptional LysR family regulator [Subtercola frigoramans]
MTHRLEITLAQLRYFVAAAEHLSMTAAAEEKFVAQSAVSSAIAQLEARAGAQLFIRRRAKGLALTPAGRRLLDDVRTLLTGLDAAIDAARDTDGEPRGTVRIGFFVTIAPFVLPEVLSRSKVRFPELLVEVEEMDAQSAAQALREGRVELALGYDFGIGDDLVREVVEATPPYVLLAADHPLAQRESIGLRELGREKLVLLDLPHSREYFLALLGSVGFEPEIRHRTPSFETVRAMVAHGHGFSILNQQPAHALAYDGGVVAAVQISDPVEPLPIVITTMQGTRQSARAAAIAGIIREVFADRQR